MAHAAATRCYRSALAALDAVQVELHGQYSIDRLRALHAYGTATATITTTTTTTTTMTRRCPLLLRAVAVLMATPLPFLLLIVSMDALPLVSPREGINKQTIGYWVRIFYTSWIMIFASIVQFGIAVPTLPMSQTRHWAISLTVGALLSGCIYIDAVVIGFPVPFALQLQATPWAVFLGSALYLSWKDTLRNDTVARQNLVRVLKVVSAQVVIFFSYVSFNAGFHASSSATVRAVLSAVLPVMKMVFKLWVSRGVHHLEDFAPVTVVFVVDVFHALFVSLAMQQSSSTASSTGATLGLIMAVDVVQCAIAVYEVRKITQRIQQLASSLPAFESDDCHLTSYVLSHALWMIDTHDHVRTHPEIARPRHLRCPLLRHVSKGSSCRSVGSVRIHPRDAQAIVPADPSIAKPAIQNKPLPPPLAAAATTIDGQQQIQVEYTQSVLKLLHMTEFYVLVEFVEVMMAAIYDSPFFSAPPARVYTGDALEAGPIHAGDVGELGRPALARTPRDHASLVTKTLAAPDHPTALYSQSTMDPMALLDMERRTGFSHNEVDEFAQRMDLISEAMEQIKNGTFDPATCKVPGYKTPEQEEKERLEKLRADHERKQKQEERQRKAKEDEREQWWRRAKLRFAMERGEHDTDDDNNDEPGDTEKDPKAQADQWANRVLAAYRTRDANDYSVWNHWVPEDPVTLEEKAAREQALEKLRNAEFEKTNPDFCQQFKDDLEKRQQTQRDRERDAEKSKLQGNRLYKRREYTQAIAQYMAALDKSPFNAAVLTNVAQCYLRLELLDDSVEFSTRALYVNPHHVKALSRRAAVWHRQQKWQEAAQDMETALRLEPLNEDVVEQHSIIVGDYHDALTQRQLQAKLGHGSAAVAEKTTATQQEMPREGEELRFIMEIVQKMDDQERVGKEKKEEEKEEGKQEEKETEEEERVNEAWLAYELMVPFVEKNADARDLLRTSGELHKLAQRLLVGLQALIRDTSSSSTSTTTTTTTAEMAKMTMEEMTTCGMLHVLATCLTDSPRNQVVLYRDVALRRALLTMLTGSSRSYQQLPLSIQEQLMRVYEEAIDAKAWKKEITTSASAIATLLSIIAAASPAEATAADKHAHTRTVVSASSILFTISGDDPHGLSALATAQSPTCLAALSHALHAQRKSCAVLSNLLGVLTNLSTYSPLRDALDAATHDSAVRTRLVRALLVLAAHFTKPSLSSTSRSAYQVCAERALAALLNFSYKNKEESLVRKELLTHKATETVASILAFVSATNMADLLVVESRTVSVLCRLHSVVSQDQIPEMRSSSLLDQLYKLCELSLPLFATGSSSTTDLWQIHAQIWCHIGWCLSAEPATKSYVQSYLYEKHALPAMVETLALVNGQKLYRRASSEPASGPERIVGNVVKVLIAMLPAGSVSDSDPESGALDSSRSPDKFWTRKRHLTVLVNSLQDLPDGLARKNVAIFLAKLCQVYGDAVKPTLRELRGLEMLLSVSKSLGTATTTKPKAVAF